MSETKGAFVDHSIPGSDPGACPKCGHWRKAGLPHDCEAAEAAFQKANQPLMDAVVEALRG